MKNMGALLLLAVGLVGAAGCRSGETTHDGSPSTTSTAPLRAGGSVVLVANLGEAEDSCGCGAIIREVRAASQKGVPTQEIDTRTNKDGAKRYRVTVVPAVVFLDTSGKELRRYEGESEETMKNMKVDLDALASAKK